MFPIRDIYLARILKNRTEHLFLVTSCDIAVTSGEIVVTSGFLLLSYLLIKFICR